METSAVATLMRLSLCVLFLTKASVVFAATVTNAAWFFSAPNENASHPVGPSQSNSVSDVSFTWQVGSHVNARYNANALRFGYSGNQSADLNNSTFTSAIAVSGLGANTVFTNIQISYDATWTGGGNLTYTLAYSLNGAAFQNFNTNAIAGGSVWATYASALSSVLTLTNGSSLAIRGTVTGASGNGNSLSFDNIMILGTSVAVPEPQACALVLVGAALFGFRCLRRNNKT